MEHITISCDIERLQWDELSKEEQQLIDSAKEATYSAYAPYSNFFVGAALRLQDGSIMIGNNQENASYPCGLCAERTALFAANSQYPHLQVTALAIAARNAEGFLKTPITPCGSCRQVMLEVEHRQKAHIKIYLYGENGVYRIASSEELLPLQFTL